MRFKFAIGIILILLLPAVVGAQDLTIISANRNLSNIRHLIDGSIDLWISSDFSMPFLARPVGIEPEKLELVYAFKKIQNYIAFSIQTPDAGRVPGKKD